MIHVNYLHSFIDARPTKVFNLDVAEQQLLVRMRVHFVKQLNDFDGLRNLLQPQKLGLHR